MLTRQSGQVVCVLNDHVPAATAPPDAPLRPEPLGRQLPPRHCFMMERPEDKAAAIDARICEGRRRLGEALGAAFGSVAPVGEPVHEDAWFVGRVVSDTEGGAPTAASLGLEGDVAASAGARAALDLSLLPAVRLFPGQVVGVRGFNPTGARIVARQVVTHCQPPAAAAARAGPTPSGMDVDSSTPGTVAAIAAGPFATADDPTCFEPLEALLAALAARPAPPALLVLVGPFVDVENPAVATGALDVTFQSLFAHQVVARVSAWQERLPSPCQVVLVPSVRDAHAMPVFPQPPLDVPGAADGVVCLQNPSCFDAGGAMVVGCTSADVLRALAGTELQQGPRTDRITALASHLLGQRRWAAALGQQNEPLRACPGRGAAIHPSFTHSKPQELLQPAPPIHCLPAPFIQTSASTLCTRLRPGPAWTPPLTARWQWTSCPTWCCCPQTWRPLPRPCPRPGPTQSAHRPVARSAAAVQRRAAAFLQSTRDGWSRATAAELTRY
jgi:hypothetical protein